MLSHHHDVINIPCCASGVVLEHAERVIKDVIAQDNMLPEHCKHLKPEEWGIELADYFECVAGNSHSSFAAFSRWSCSCP